ncbi:MAG: hypothetical protein A2901_00935 [Elusimicrobia bacterium RIFCSPLOWO2_01_FULL_54_10]|nr:MAG: hypothetical protein A2901_00935 [Elusimicrobia bacterium RIFCSPLOWO2_01_FULL_54_10]
MALQKTEISAGGIVLKKNPPQVLMVQVKNLIGKIVWTFPKGHLEKGETAAQAAVREVLEETGWDCKIPPRARKPFLKVQYFFRRGKSTIRKKVVWFWMAPGRKTGSRDPKEIRRVRWAGLAAAKRLIKYPSDKQILKRLQATIE